MQDYYSQCFLNDNISVRVKDINVEKSADWMGFFDMGHGVFDTFAVFTVNCQNQFVSCLFINCFSSRAVLIAIPENNAIKTVQQRTEGGQVWMR